MSSGTNSSDDNFSKEKFEELLASFKARGTETWNLESKPDDASIPDRRFVLLNPFDPQIQPNTGYEWEHPEPMRGDPYSGWFIKGKRIQIDSNSAEAIIGRLNEALGEAFYSQPLFVEADQGMANLVMHAPEPYRDTHISKFPLELDGDVATGVRFDYQSDLNLSAGELGAISGAISKALAPELPASGNSYQNGHIYRDGGKYPNPSGALTQSEPGKRIRIDSHTAQGIVDRLNAVGGHFTPPVFVEATQETASLRVPSPSPSLDPDRGTQIRRLPLELDGNGLSPAVVLDDGSKLELSETEENTITKAIAESRAPSLDLDLDL